MLATHYEGQVVSHLCDAALPSKMCVAALLPLAVPTTYGLRGATARSNIPICERV